MDPAAVLKTGVRKRRSLARASGRVDSVRPLLITRCCFNSLCHSKKNVGKHKRLGNARRKTSTSAVLPPELRHVFICKNNDYRLLLLPSLSVSLPLSLSLSLPCLLSSSFPPSLLLVLTPLPPNRQLTRMCDLFDHIC